jgi:hypothetical protein
MLLWILRQPGGYTSIINSDQRIQFGREMTPISKRVYHIQQFQRDRNIVTHISGVTSRGGSGGGECAQYLEVGCAEYPRNGTSR